MYEDKPVILFRDSVGDESELNIVKKIFHTYTNRTAIPDNKLVIGRYSVLPYYKELEEDLKLYGCKLINSYTQHNFCADITEWYSVLAPYTFTTWCDIRELPFSERGPFVVKGKTNSRKHEWNTRMFAPSMTELGPVIANLMDDPLVSEQGVIIRKYEPLITILEGINGLPITEEYRIFIYRNNIVASGFYWSSYEEDVKEKLGSVPKLPQDNETRRFILSVIDSIAEHPRAPNFYAMDIAKTQAGKWVLVEINDGQMSGLSCIAPKTFYENLHKLT